MNIYYSVYIRRVDWKLQMISYTNGLCSNKKGGEKHATPAKLLDSIRTNRTAYEVICMNDRVVPYFDYDPVYESESEMFDNFERDLKRVELEISSTYENATMIMLVSPGKDIDKERLGERKIWKNSINVIVRGAGYFNSNRDIIKPVGGTYDNSVYKSYQKLRLPFCTKEGHGRYKNIYINGKIFDIDNFNESGIKFEDLLVTYTHNEKTQIDYEELSELSDESVDESVDASDDESDSPSDESAMVVDYDALKKQTKVQQHKPQNTVDQFEKLLNVLDVTKRVEDYNQWMLTMRVCKNIIKSFSTDNDFINGRRIVHDLMNKDSRNGAYKQTEVDTFLDRTDEKEDTIGWGTLIRWSREDTKPAPKKKPSKKDKLNKDIKKGDIFNVGRIEKLQRHKQHYYWSDHKIFNGLKLKKPDDIIKYMVDTSFKINGGGKTTYITHNRAKTYDKDGNPKYIYTKKTMGTNPFASIEGSVNFKLNGTKYELYKFSQMYFKKYSYDYTEMLPYAGADDPYLNKDDNDSDRVYNKFEPFPNASYVYKDESTATFDRMMWHIRHIVSSDDDVIFKYIVGWLAWTVQFPNIKQETCILLQALEGAGKNKFVEIVRSLVGEHNSFDTGEIDDIIGQFNSQLSGKLLVIGDELVSYAGFKKSDKIKNMTTCPNINVTKKGIDTIQERSYHRFIFTTNNVHTLRISNEDRRILVVAVSNSKIGDHEYFQQLSNEMDSPDNIKKLFDYLMAYDLSEFNFRKVPITQLKRDMVINQLDDMYDWFLEYGETRMKYDRVKPGEELRIKADDAYDKYVEYSNNKVRRKDFKEKMVRLLQCEYKKLKTGRHYIFDVVNTNKYLCKLMKLDTDPLPVV